MKKTAIVYFFLFIISQTQSYSQSLLETIARDSITISSHRGVRILGEEENSIKSLSNASSEGISLHEIDIMESLDGKLYLLHDETLDRTTNLEGYIKDTHSSLLDGAILKGSGENLPTFDDALHWAKINGAYLMLDVKAAPVAKVMAEVEKHEMMDKVMLLTFSKERAKEAIAYPKNFLISVLIEKEEDIDFYKSLFTDKNFWLGYINKTAESKLYHQVRSKGIIIITDTMGELDTEAQQDGGKSYLNFIRAKKPDILVSDYPLELKKAVKMHL